MDLSGIEVWIIIILVVGIIASNLAVLKYSARFKMPQFGAPKKPNSDNNANSIDKAESATDNNSETKEKN
ncbi:DUF2897 family protein [Shewanella electrodiphila]|uniref:DUF2897 family protein n=1 Tax=Shewanella electrodiphila TaxID=934143 RepID=A0ABT0KQ30_9GAMM|nr:DUF2897 family protein [Shewanella electrodiphila]MCL1045962.1 DUF2897 family protein [Shewanella electrodiphila]